MGMLLISALMAGAAAASCSSTPVPPPAPDDGGTPRLLRDAALPDVDETPFLDGSAPPSDAAPVDAGVDADDEAGSVI